MINICHGYWDNMPYLIYMYYHIKGKHILVKRNTYIHVRVFVLILDTCIWQRINIKQPSMICTCRSYINKKYEKFKNRKVISE